MSILICGIEMPTDSPMWIVVHSDGTVETNDVGTTGWLALRNAAVLVPPHGLIDREQILDAIRLELEMANAVNDMDDYDAWMRIFDYVRKFPTIIEAEVKE